MVTLDFKACATPVGIVRLLEVVLTCITFSLVASALQTSESFWVWCMFTWCFCFAVTILIIVFEFTTFNTKLPISWDDFTTAFAMLATLMILAASIIYPVNYTCLTCGRQIGASVCSCVAFILYAVEVGLTRAKAGEISGFLSTVPGLLKVLETFVACIIFICLNSVLFTFYPGLQWCIAVYSICFIFSLLIIILTIGRLLALIPALNKVLITVNVLSALMYLTTVIIWPVFSLKDNPRPNICHTFPNCQWNKLVVISFMSCVNLIAYIVDTVYSVRLVFFVSTTTAEST